jgi:hypothetical protein
MWLQVAPGLLVGYDLLPSLHAAAADERYRPIGGHGDRFRSMAGWVEEQDHSDRDVATHPPGGTSAVMSSARGAGPGSGTVSAL